MFDQLNVALARYKFILWLIVATLVAFGFDFKTPARHFEEIETSLEALHRTDTILERRITVADSARTEMTFYLRALMIAQCIDRPLRQTQLMGLPCGDLLNPRPMK